MTPDDALRSCPCGSQAPLSACCSVYLDRQQNPPTAEALMRSRYTAFVQRNAEYLLATWDPGHRPAQLDLKKDRTEWLGLQILATEAGRAADSQGRVSFVAHFRLDGSAQALRENSRFRKVAGRWLYIDGQVLPAPLLEPRAAAARPDVGRNDPCPCGSGQKYKRCCGK